MRPARARKEVTPVSGSVKTCRTRYWCRRCARQLREDVSPTAELQEIKAALLGGQTT
jgi:hypothetical protein